MYTMYTFMNTAEFYVNENEWLYSLIQCISELAIWIASIVSYSAKTRKQDQEQIRRHHCM